MGKKRYYCDFCDKSFSDNPQIRKKHNNGLQHSAAKRSHYAKFKEPEEILADDVDKEKCRRYMTTGECQFGDNCRYSHITPDIHHQLKYRVEMKRTVKAESQLSTSKPDLQSWLIKEGLVDSPEDPRSPTDPGAPREDEEQVLPEPLPDCLRHIPLHELPPSLLPPLMRVCVPAPTPDWGE